MTKLSKTIVRLTSVELGGRYGPDRGRKIVAMLVPGGIGRPDQLVLRPHGTRRPEVLNLDDAYQLAIRQRTDREWAKRMAARKAKKAERLARQRQERAEKRGTLESQILNSRVR